MLPMRHFFVLFFDEESNEYLEKVSREIFMRYCPGQKYPSTEHHLTVQYFQCEERHYEGLVEEVAAIVATELPVSVGFNRAEEYVNEMNDFCCVSLQAEKKGDIVRLHNSLTKPLDKLFLNYEPLQAWPPHVTCFPGLKLEQRLHNWNGNFDSLVDQLPVLHGVQLRLTRWTGSHIETIHRFAPVDLSL